MPNELFFGSWLKVAGYSLVLGLVGMAVRNLADLPSSIDGRFLSLSILAFGVASSCCVVFIIAEATIGRKLRRSLDSLKSRRAEMVRKE